MPREHTVIVSGSITNANGDYDLLECVPASGKMLELLNFEIGQTTELGDAADEQLDISVVRGNTTSGNGSAVTPRPKEAGSTIASTYEALGSTPASAGTAVTLWNATGKVLLPGPLWTPLPQGAGFFVSGSDLLCIRLNAAVADDVTFRGTATLLEYG